MSGQPGTFASLLGLVAAFYLIRLPVAQLVVVPLGGAMATAADLALGGLVAAGLEAFVTSPLVGVGAAPFLAPAPGPFGGPSLHLWDTHQPYLSVLGQFGLLGAVLAGTGVVLLVRGLLAEPRIRARAAVLAALAAMAAHGFLVATEDARHLWALLGGMVGALGIQDEGPTG